MKTLLKALSVIVLGAIGAGGVIYADSVCPKKQAEQQARIEQAIEKYVKSHSLTILENIARNEEFSNAVKNFSGLNEEEIASLTQKVIENRPEIFEGYVRQNADFIASTLIETGKFANTSTEGGEASTEYTDNSEENKAFLEHWDEMINNEVSPSVGPKDAKVTVVEFFDFACGHCKALAPIMSQLMKDNPDVRFIFNPLFFISEYSPYASKVSLAAYEKGKFAEVFDGIMTLPEMTEDSINQILTDEGLNVDEVKTAIEEKKIRRGIQDIDSLSQVLGINGVPMLIINGVPFYGRSLEDLQNKINSLK